RRPAGDLRRNYWIRRESGLTISLQPPTLLARFVYGQKDRAANCHEAGGRRSLEADCRPCVSACGGSGRARVSRSGLAVRQGGSLGLGSSKRLCYSRRVRGPKKERGNMA